jgi:CubicO group peptidase (beta-lactamase class C family)
MKLAVAWLCLCVVLHGAELQPLSAFDDFMNGVLVKWRIPGAALGVSHNGRLHIARGYGIADVETGQPVRPDSLFRVAGISKTITAAAILRLVEDGKISLDDYAPALTAKEVTIRQLLQGPELSACGNSNADLSDAYWKLGRIIEKASGQLYESFVKSALLKPLGISRMQIGHPTLSQRTKDEVRYYDFPGAPSIQSIPRPDGAVNVEALEAGGGWIASVYDLMRFVNALDGRRPPMLLKPETLRTMVAPPSESSAGASCYAGLGWMIEPAGADAGWRQFGGLPGSSAYVLRQAATGVDVVLLFNSRPADSAAFEAELSTSVVRTIHSIKQWPATDEFAGGPELFARDVVNAADYSVGGVTPGELLVMFPSNTGPPDLVPWGLEGNLKAATSTGETRLLFDDVAARVFYTVRCAARADDERSGPCLGGRSENRHGCCHDNPHARTFCETACAGFYHNKLGRPSLPPGQYFRVMMIGFFEGLDSERGIAWRLADSLTLRQFLSIGLDEKTPDHVTISRTRPLIDGETHQRLHGAA